MNAGKNDGGGTMGWYVAYGLAASLFIIAIMNSDFLRELACSEDDKSCLREWISALGGWAAVVVAGPTLYFLWRQVDTAQKQAKDTFSIELRRSLALAYSTRRAGRDLTIWSTLFKSEPQSYTTPEAWVNLRNNVSDVEETLQLEVFTLFEREIAFPKHFHTAFLRDRIRVFKNLHRADLEGGRVPLPAQRDEIVMRWNGILDQASEYGSECVDLADKFIAESNQLIRKYA